MTEALPRKVLQGGGNRYPEVPDVVETLNLLAEKYAFRVSGSGLKPFARWAERREEVLLPTQNGVRYVVEAHYVFPKLNLHVIHVRSKWCVDSHCEDSVHERIEFMPWAPSHVSVKDTVMGREVGEYDN